MKNKKGFTLVELLAVIVILAVVSIVAIPIIINLIEEAKKGALKDSVEGLTKAADMYYFQNMKNTEEGVQIEIINNEQTAPQEPKLNYKGDVKNAYVLIAYDGKVAVCVDDNKYFASRALDSKKIVTDLGSCTNEFDDELQTFITVGSANYVGLRLNVRALSNKPTSSDKASEGTIGVVTDSKVTGYFVSPVAPQEPKDGTVWVVQKSDSEVRVNNKTSQVGVAYVVQYEDGDWNLKDAYVYNDTWIPINDYDNALYEWEFNYNGQYQEFQAPYSGYYEIELWGAQGASYGSYVGGRGAYTKGDLYLNKDEMIYIYIGGAGSSSAGGWNGGGSASNDSNYYNRAGGGATDVRTKPTAAKTTWNEAESLKSRIMVAGGGGGAGHATAGGAGGGLNGISGSVAGGTQISGISGTGASSGFGYGANGYNLASGGGSGWYGGGQHTYCYDCSAGGGSSYISGHEGCVSIDNLQYITGGYVSHMNKYFINTLMIDGQGYKWTTSRQNQVGMPTYDGKSTMVGNNNHGHAKIKFKEFNAYSESQYDNMARNIQNTWQYAYMGYYQEFKAPKAGTYKIELWGAVGGSNAAGGRGAYTSGEIDLKKDQILYVYVGGAGGTAGGWNGGGNASNDSNNRNRGGGGATDVRTVPTSARTTWSGIESLKSRIMVAAGGGGGGAANVGGAGGGLTGISGSVGGGTQVSGVSGTGSNSGFGQGAHGYNLASGGGSGWYGGGQHTYCYDCSGGGGSSYISGHEGCVGMNENTTMKNTSATSIEDSYSYTGFIFKNTKMIDGTGYQWTTQKGSSVVNMPTTNYASMMTGNASHGYARITFIK